MSSRFSSRQIVAMVIAVCTVIVLTPTTVWAAATASKVQVTDGTGRVAQVDKSGRLLVGDGQGPLTVDGTVTPTVPGKPFYYHAELTTLGGAGLVFDGGMGKSLYVTSFSVREVTADHSADTQEAGLYLLIDPPSGDCNNSFNAAVLRNTSVQATTAQTVQLTFPTTPLPFTSPKHHMCVKAVFPVFNQTGKTYIFDVLGYTTG